MGESDEADNLQFLTSKPEFNQKIEFIGKLASLLSKQHISHINKQSNSFNLMETNLNNAQSPVIRTGLLERIKTARQKTKKIPVERLVSLFREGKRILFMKIWSTDVKPVFHLIRAWCGKKGLSSLIPNDNPAVAGQSEGELTELDLEFLTKQYFGTLLSNTLTVSNPHYPIQIQNAKKWKQTKLRAMEICLNVYFVVLILEKETDASVISKYISALEKYLQYYLSKNDENPNANNGLERNSSRLTIHSVRPGSRMSRRTENILQNTTPNVDPHLVDELAKLGCSQSIFNIPDKLKTSSLSDVADDTEFAHYFSIDWYMFLGSKLNEFLVQLDQVVSFISTTNNLAEYIPNPQENQLSYLENSLLLMQNLNTSLSKTHFTNCTKLDNLPVPPSVTHPTVPASQIQKDSSDKSDIADSFWLSVSLLDFSFDVLEMLQHFLPDTSQLPNSVGNPSTNATFEILCSSLKSLDSRFRLLLEKRIALVSSDHEPESLERQIQQSSDSNHIAEEIPIYLYLDSPPTRSCWWFSSRIDVQKMSDCLSKPENHSLSDIISTNSHITTYPEFENQPKTNDQTNLDSSSKNPLSAKDCWLSRLLPTIESTYLLQSILWLINRSQSQYLRKKIILFLVQNDLFCLSNSQHSQPKNNSNSDENGQGWFLSLFTKDIPMKFNWIFKSLDENEFVQHSDSQIQSKKYLISATQLFGLIHLFYVHHTVFTTLQTIDGINYWKSHSRLVFSPSPNNIRKGLIGWLLYILHITDHSFSSCWKIFQFMKNLHQPKNVGLNSPPDISNENEPPFSVTFAASLIFQIRHFAISSLVLLWPHCEHSSLDIKSTISWLVKEMERMIGEWRMLTSIATGELQFPIIWIHYFSALAPLSHLLVSLASSVDSAKFLFNLKNPTSSRFSQKTLSPPWHDYLLDVLLSLLDFNLDSLISVEETRGYSDMVSQNVLICLYLGLSYGFVSSTGRDSNTTTDSFLAIQQDLPFLVQKWDKAQHSCSQDLHKVIQSLNERISRKMPQDSFPEIPHSNGTVGSGSSSPSLSAPVFESFEPLQIWMSAVSERILVDNTPFSSLSALVLSSLPQGDVLLRERFLKQQFSAHLNGNSTQLRSKSLLNFQSIPLSGSSPDSLIDNTKAKADNNRSVLGVGIGASSGEHIHRSDFRIPPRDIASSRSNRPQSSFRRRQLEGLDRFSSTQNLTHIPEFG